MYYKYYIFLYIWLKLKTFENENTLIFRTEGAIFTQKRVQSFQFFCVSSQSHLHLSNLLVIKTRTRELLKFLFPPLKSESEV